MIPVRFFLTLLLCLTVATAALAGSDAAVVPDDRIPWSGYWWPRNLGYLVNGYSEHPSPMEKYDAYVSGYYPAAAMTKGYDREYDPDAPNWYGYCDAWAAASIVEPEPDAPGQLNGIPFAVGDKKGLLTALYHQNYTPILFGSRYNGEEDDSQDLYPGGIDGFHQVLINYIAVQGLPIIADTDPGIEIWSYPVYRYEMTWTDEGTIRHVTCTIWMADDFVTQDFVGTRSYTETYTYDLVLDDNGELADEPGQWTGASVDNHPDFLWFPSSIDKSHPYLDNAVVRTIVDSEIDAGDDIFETNNTLEQAHPIGELDKSKYYWGSSQDDDWYRVALEQGDYFYAFILSPSDDLNVHVFDAQGNPMGISFYHGTRVDQVPHTGYYYVNVNADVSDGSYYNVQFFVSPNDVIPHVASTSGWDTTVTMLGQEWYFDQVRINLFDAAKALVDQVDVEVPEHERHTFSMNGLFGERATAGVSAKLTSLDGEYAPRGYYSYRKADRLVNFPFGTDAGRKLVLPAIERSAGWYTGVALMNTHPMDAVRVDVTSYSLAGAVVGSGQFDLDPGQSRVGFAQTFGSVPANAAWIEFNGDGLLQGTAFWHRDEGGANRGIAGIPLLRDAHADRTLYLAHAANTTIWSTRAVIVNANEAPAAIQVTGYDPSGNAVASGSFTIVANGSWAGPCLDLMDTGPAQQVAWIKIQANRDIYGYQLFARRKDSLAALPLITSASMKTEHRLTLTADWQSGWIGLVLLNDNGVKNDVWAAPLDDQGNNLLGDQYLWYNSPQGMGANSNAVGFIDKVFSGLPPDTVTLVIRSDEPMAGFALVNNDSEGQLDVLYLD